MSIPIVCEACDYHFKVKDDFAGRKGKCPKCSDIFLAPGGDKAPAKAKMSPKTRTRPAQSRKKVAVSSKAASNGKKRKVARGAAVGKQAPKAVKVKSVALPTGQAVAATPQTSVVSARRRRRRSAAPIWIWLLLGGSAIAAGIGWALFATDNLNLKDKQVADQGKQQQAASKKEEKEKDSETEENEKSTESTTEETEPAKKEKDPDSDDGEKQNDETKSTNNKTPEPAAPEKPSGPTKSSVTAEQVNTLAAACREFQWQPKSKENYAQMAQCALLMNQAFSEEGTDAAADAAGEIFQELAVLKWNANDIRAVNRFAAARMNDIGAGAFLLVEVKRDTGARAMAQLIETGEMVMVEYDKSQAEATPSDKWLILGVNSPKETKINFDPEGKISQKLRNVKQMFLVKISIQTKAEKFGPDP